MKRIGIMTLFHENYNYGAALQAFALQKALETVGYEAKVLDYQRLIQPIGVGKGSLAQKIKKKLAVTCKGDVINLISYPFSKKLQAEKKPLLDARKAKFQAFYQAHMAVSAPYDIATIDMANNDFDAFVCGSDQVWRPGSFDPNYYLNFADEDKVRFSYAASMGVRELSADARSAMIPLIEKLNRISVREQEAQDILRKYTDRDIQVVLDPTLLWDSAFWKNIARMPEGVTPGKYVFCYLIGENNRNRDSAKAIAAKLGLPLAAIPGVSRVQAYDFQYADINLADVGPDEFLGLILNAAAVVTDSFHACVFSILFGKTFYALERFNRNDKNSMNGRIYDLLNMFSLDSRLIPAGMDADTSVPAAAPEMERYDRLKADSWAYLKSTLTIVADASQSVIHTLPHVFACQSHDRQIRLQSSSGGLFYHLAVDTLSRGGKVIACRMDDQSRAVHAVCESVDELSPFLTSKYVQSQIGSAFAGAESALRAGADVLFVGTPCQIQGLTNYLSLKKAPTERLLKVDFICHGVPSPGVWREYYREIVASEKAGAHRVCFRDKVKGWRRFSLTVDSAGEPGRRLYAADKESDRYIRGFLGNLYLRPSCYDCRFKSVHHPSDLTLGDFWHFEKCRSSIRDDDTGVSLVVAQSEKGLAALRAAQGIAVEEVPCSTIAYANKNMLRSALWTERRERFFPEYDAFKKTYAGKTPMHDYLKAQIKDSPEAILKKTVKKMIRK